MQFVDGYKVTENAVLNNIFAGHIKTRLDVVYYLSGYAPDMSVRDVTNLIDDLVKVGKIK